MKVNPHITKLIDEAVTAARKTNVPSGRMAASRLAWPLQWKMLHYYKVPQKEVDEFTLRKFQRGTDVENRIVEWVKPEQAQVPVTYRGVAGIADMVIGGLPYEVKSVTNRNFPYLQKRGPNLSHRIQGMLYAKALGVPTFFIVYVASDDYRVLTYEEQVTEEVDNLIDEYETQVKLGVVPTLTAKEPWHDKKEYSPYPEFIKLTEEQIRKKLGQMGIVLPTPLPL